MISHTDFDGRRGALTYDGAGRTVQGVDVTMAPTGTTTMTTTMSYDPNGNIAGQVTQTQVGTGTVQTHTTTHAYNANDWLVTTTSDGLMTTYGYDAAGQPRTQTIVDGITPVTMTLDPGGRATMISEGAGGAGPFSTNFGYNANDQIVSIITPGGVQQTAGFDGDNRVTSVNATGPATGSPATTLSSSYAYSYDGLGLTSSTTTLSGTDTILHDAEGHITNDAGPQVVASGGVYHWTYDQNGNILSQIGDDGAPVTYTYSPNVPNEVQTMVMGNGQPTSFYHYDVHGDTTSITDGAKINTQIAYDAEARPVQIAYLDRGIPTTVTLAYNADGQRSRYTVSVANQPTLDEQFQYRDDQLGQVTVMTGGVTLYTDTYIYNQDATPLEFLRQQGGTTNRYWYVLDGRDNVVAVTDVTGKVVDRYAYDPWGELVSNDGTNETVPQQLRYAGYWYDEKLSWYWLSVRYYDPEIERWLQPDPSESDGVRTYAYAGDSPLDATDPTGFSAQGYTNIPSSQWIAHSVDKSQNGADPINVVLTAGSILDAPGLFSLMRSRGATWFQVVIGGLNLTAEPVSSFQANVYPPVSSRGTAPQQEAWRNGGLRDFFGLNTHVRGWTQAQPNGSVAWFLAASREQFRDLWHYILTEYPGGYDIGRDNLVSDVKLYSVIPGSRTTPPRDGPPLHEPAPFREYTLTVGQDHPYHSGVGTNRQARVRYSGVVYTLTLNP